MQYTDNNSVHDKCGIGVRRRDNHCGAEQVLVPSDRIRPFWQWSYKQIYAEHWAKSVSECRPDLAGRHHLGLAAC